MGCANCAESREIADSYFIVKRLLGSGRTGAVDHVISKLSLQEYAVSDELEPSPLTARSD
jgi:hypothetical protein